ncbi:MAG: hypothetical protein WD066_10550 [Planctomycetaceae bacterium]
MNRPSVARIGAAWLAPVLPISGVAAQLPRYARRFGVIFGLVWRALKLRLVLVLGLSLLATAMRGAAVAALMLFVHQAMQESGESARWTALIAFGPERPLWSGTLCLALFIGSTLLSFWCARLTARYALKVVESVLDGRFAEAVAGDPNLEQRSIQTSLASGGAQFASISLTLLNVPLAVLTIVMGFGFMFWISMPVTLGLLMFFPVMLLPLYFLNRNIAREAREMRSISPDVGARNKQTAAAIMEARDEPSSVREILAAHLGSTSIRRRNQIMEQLWTLGPRVALVSATFNNLLLVAFAFGLPFLLTVVKIPTAHVLGFIICFRQALGGVQQLAQRLSRMVRFLEPAECLLDPSRAKTCFPAGEGIVDDADMQML